MAVVAAVVAVVVLLQAHTSLAQSCISDPAPVSTYSNLNNVVWDGSVYGFCEGLFAADDLIMPLQAIACDGENEHPASDFAIMTRGLGALTGSCRAAVARLSCYLKLPRFHSGASSPQLACTSAQRANDTSATTIAQWLLAACAEQEDLVGDVVLAAQAADGQWAGHNDLRPICRDVDVNDGWYPELWFCPAGLIQVQGADDHRDNSLTGCQVACPGPVFSDHEYDVLEGLLDIVGPISLGLLLICMISWAMMKDKMRFPSNLIFALFVAILLIHLDLMIGNFHGSHKKVWCSADGYTYHGQDHFGCGLQGAGLVYAGKAALICWFCIILNAYLTFVKRAKNLEAYFKWYILASFGWPLIGPIVLLAADKVEYTIASSWCFVSAEKSGLWQYMFFYLDMFVGLIGGFLLSALTLIHMSQHDANMKLTKARTKDNKRVQNRMRAFRYKVIALCFWVFWELMFFLCYRIDGSVQDDKLNDAVVDWAVCLFQGYLGLVENYENTCEIVHLPSFALLVGGAFLIVGNGILVSTLFCFSAPDVLEFWVLIAKTIWYKITRSDQLRPTSRALWARSSIARQDTTIQGAEMTRLESNTSTANPTLAANSMTPTSTSVLVNQPNSEDVTY